MLDFGGQSGTKASSSPSTSVFPDLCHRTIARDRLYHQGVVTVGRSTKRLIATAAAVRKPPFQSHATAGRSDE